MYEQYIPAPAPSKTEFNLFNSEMTKVIIGNTSTDNVATGEYVSLKKSIISGLSDGIYKSKSNIASGTPFVSSNLEAVTGGAVNALNDGLDVLNGKIENLFTVVDESAYLTNAITMKYSGLNVQIPANKNYALCFTQIYQNAAPQDNAVSISETDMSPWSLQGRDKDGGAVCVCGRTTSAMTLYFWCKAGNNMQNTVTCKGCYW